MDATERALTWLNEECFDEETKAEVRKLAFDADALKARFGTEMAFGTGGLRGKLGIGTSRMNRYTVARATQGLAAYVKEIGGKRVAIAYDTRLGSREFAGIAAGVLAENGIEAMLFDRIMPTPVLSFAVRALSCDAGIVITASHNPPEYNGYKVYGADGGQITERVAERILSLMEKTRYADLRWRTEEEAVADGLLTTVPRAVYDAYIEATLSCRAWRDGAEQPLSILYTPLHGTGLEPVRDVCARLSGLSLRLVQAQCTPDGRFPTCRTPNPEQPEALRLAIEAARSEGIRLVLATDPDADRVGVAERQADGRYQLFTGNEIGLLLLEFMLSEKARRGALPERPLVLKTIVTSDLARPIAAAYGAEVVDVLTGFKYIGESIGGLEARGEAERFVFGFEESCGYLAGTHVRDKDGVMAAMLVAEMAQCLAARGETLSGALDRLYQTYGYAGTMLKGYDIAGATPMESMRGLMRRLRESPPEALLGEPIGLIRDYAAGLDGLPPSDVLAFETASGLKAIVRPSGTEPKVKLYLSARGKDAEAVGETMRRMAGELEGRMGLQNA